MFNKDNYHFKIDLIQQEILLMCSNAPMPNRNTLYSKLIGSRDDNNCAIKGLRARRKLVKTRIGLILRENLNSHMLAMAKMNLLLGRYENLKNRRIKHIFLYILHGRIRCLNLVTGKEKDTVAAICHEPSLLQSHEIKQIIKWSET